MPAQASHISPAWNERDFPSRGAEERRTEYVRCDWCLRWIQPHEDLAVFTSDGSGETVNMYFHARPEAPCWESYRIRVLRARPVRREP